MRARKAHRPPGPATPDPRDDPLALLAEAAGYDDHELWWERQIEQRQDISGFFEGILEAMSAIRDGAPPRDAREAQREAHMRQAIRAAMREGYQRIAVVYGRLALARPARPRRGRRGSRRRRAAQERAAREGGGDLGPVDQFAAGLSRRLRRWRHVAGLV